MIESAAHGKEIGMDTYDSEGKEKAERSRTIREDADSFWNIDELMPRRRVHSSPAPRRQTEAVKFEFRPDAEAAVDDSASVKVPPRVGGASGATTTAETERRSRRKEDGGQVEMVYEPQGGFLHRVTVFRWQTGYSYYEQFLRNAKRFENAVSHPAPHVPFFSYMPQYSQLDSAQLAFYLFWRDEVRADRAPHADYSYILLYIYELINLYSGTPRASHALDRLCFLWRSYRDEYPRIDVQLADWVRDMCLVNGLPAPFEKIVGIPAANCAGRDVLREFYIDSSQDEMETALLSYCSSYDWHRSKYAVGDALPLYQKHVWGAARAALRAGGGVVGIHSRMRDHSIMRDAYVGALCAPCAKRRMKIEYCSFTASYEARTVITDIVKYSENRLRAALGIKSRLSCGPLPTEVRGAINAYFSTEYPPAAIRGRQNKIESPPEYERLYDPLPQNNTLSIENAARIEEESWVTTDRLLDAFDDAGIAVDGSDHDSDDSVADISAVFADDGEKTETPQNFDIGANKDTEIDTNTDTDNDNDTADGGSELAEALGELCEFVLYAAEGDVAAERRIAADMGTVADVVADRVNEIAAENFGDIILEERDGAWCVILDYLDEVREALSSRKKDSDR